MWRILSLMGILLLFTACHQPDEKKINDLEKRIVQLEKELSSVYKPGFGEMMGEIQMHHAKLWFAGKNNNWHLADFEIEELDEIIENIEKYQKDRKETEYLNMIEPALDSLKSAIRQKDGKLFEKNYLLFTKACNECHVATDFGYNRVKVPDTPPVDNQVFEIE